MRWFHCHCVLICSHVSECFSRVFVRKLANILTQVIMMYLGFGILNLFALAVVSQYFHKYTAIAMGASSASSVTVIYPMILIQI
ncbi:hypothetical protein BJ875DRAFT_132552 [Amylocarpus encephaloides]|uniref:Uncharacterized protein n=1 Tax=Amylocarpus encephaloides TaxID=45428 RepID=A0A9P8C2L2_9HELO|nr:hypothetical protein BJ875DRAFT_132552 [Amylocarpus encephaloides]